ncbi:Isochorismatase-like protein [Whalleya microplaca]|nr:Isochorismatase-like protein [Whalleya microplaca]
MRGSTVVAKNTYDAFINTNLGQVLEKKAIDRVVVCGVMTDCCCDTTARSAFNRGYETWLVGDACGSANKTQHEAGLRGFGFAFGKVLTTEEVIGLLRGDE